MIITKDTTIKEYEAWLATNPPLSAFKKAVRKTFMMIYRTIGRVGQVIKRTKRHACTAGRVQVKSTVYPLTYDKNAVQSVKGAYGRIDFRIWLAAIHLELKATTSYISTLESCSYWNALSHIDDEIAMEEVKIEALEILNK